MSLGFMVSEWAVTPVTVIPSQLWRHTLQRKTSVKCQPWISTLHAWFLSVSVDFVDACNCIASRVTLKREFVQVHLLCSGVDILNYFQVKKGELQMQNESEIKKCGSRFESLNIVSYLLYSIIQCRARKEKDGGWYWYNWVCLKLESLYKMHTA